MTKFTKFSLIVVIAFAIISFIFNEQTEFDINMMYYSSLLFLFGYLTALVDFALSLNREKSLIFKF